MQIKENVDLKSYSTMRVGGKARYFAAIESELEIFESVKWAKNKNQPIIMIGGGSNLIWADEGYQGLVLLNRIKGHKVVTEDENYVVMEMAAGEDWDKMVELTVKQGLSGIEQLSWIPGRVGATPVQNVGAYGREVAEVLVSVRAFDLEKNDFTVIEKADCGFGYRTSRFKTIDKGRFLISSITLKLSKHNAKPPFYSSLEKWLEENNIKDFSPQNIRQGVINVRQKKLPDPDEIANNGSFFANPIVNLKVLENIQKEYDEVPSWPVDHKSVKISAGWLIETAGFKDYYDPETGMATWDKQSLVIINKHAKSTKDVLKFKQKIVDAVKDKFGITLQQEPELI